MTTSTTHVPTATPEVYTGDDDAGGTYQLEVWPDGLCVLRYRALGPWTTWEAPIILSPVLRPPTGYDAPVVGL